MNFAFDNSFYREMTGFYAPEAAAVPPAPRMLAFNHALAESLGLVVGDCDETALARLFSGGEMPKGAEPVALAYAGHQFGHFSSQLGDGRALLLGEILSPGGERFDIQLKGSGPTAFSRNGDGKAAIGPVLREFLVSEAMHALGISTTRSLAAVATGERIQRERALPGAVLTRVASSHIRVGTFQFFAAHFGTEHVIQLSNYAIRRHYPGAADAANPHLSLLDRVIERQCDLVASWLGVGFVHGVMNTDNVAISGETIDYGPCAFMDHFAVDTVFSSIDANGRYAYARQPQILHWNMARFAEALLPAIHAVSPDDVEAAKALVDAIPDRFLAGWLKVMRRKLGLAGDAPRDAELIDTLFSELERHRVDFTAFFRALAQVARGDGDPLQHLLPDGASMAGWIADWWARMESGPVKLAEAADMMDAVNPVYIPRNYLVEAALATAENGDMAAFDQLLAVVRQPFAERPDWQSFARPGPEGTVQYVTYCGT